MKTKKAISMGMWMSGSEWTLHGHYVGIIPALVWDHYEIWL